MHPGMSYFRPALMLQLTPAFASVNASLPSCFGQTVAGLTVSGLFYHTA